MLKPRSGLDPVNTSGNMGVTLIEVLVTMGILSTMLLVLVSLLASSIDVQTRSQSYSSVNTNAQFIMARLNYDIARASAVSTPTSLGGSASSLVITVGGSPYSYALSGNNLVLTDNSGSDTLNDNDITVSGLNFTELGNSGGKPTITYNFTLTGTAQTHGVHASTAYTSAEELR